MATLKDVAEKAGVSIATVSYILNGRKKFSDEIEKKVKKAAISLNYQPNIAARALRKGYSSNIALIVPDLSNPWFSELVHHITLKAQHLNIQLSIFTTLYDEDTQAQTLDKIDRLGMMACLMVPSGSHVKTKLKTPLLLLDRQADDLPCISFDNYHGGRLQAQHALELNCKHALVLCNPHISSSAAQRLKGIEDGLGTNISYKVMHQDFSNILEAEIIDYILSQHADVIICAADIIASAVIRLAAEYGINIPENMALIGFDNVYYAPILYPPLTTIDQSAELLAEQALLEISQYLEHPQNKLQFTSSILPTNLIIRKSTLK